MATAFSQPFQYSPYVENWDKDLLLKALSYKQGMYDTNRQKIQETINSVAGIDLAKSEDAEYLYGKIQDTLDVVEQYGAGDLSLDSRTDYLKGHIASIADENVMNGYIGTTKIRNIQKEAAEAKKNGLYSDLNFEYSMNQGAVQWLNDGTVGSEYTGSSTYVPYSDNNKKMLEIIKQLEPNAYAVRSLSGEYEFYKEGTILSPAQIKGAIELLIDSDPMASKQMQVNAWGQFKGMDDTTFFSQAQPIISAITASNQNDIKQLERERDKISDINDLQRKELQSVIDNKKSQISSLSNNRTALENYIYRSNTINNYANTFAYARTKQEVGVNEGYWKRLDYDLSVKKLQLEQGSKVFDTYKEINQLKSDGKFAEAKGLWDLALNNGIIPSVKQVNGQLVENTYTNDIVDNTTRSLTATEQVVNEVTPIATLNELNQKQAQQYSDLSNRVRTILQHRTDIDLNTYTKGTAPTPLLPTTTSTTYGPTEVIDLDASISFLQSKNTSGQYTDIINEYEKLQGDITKVTEVESSLKGLTSNKVLNWVNNPKEGNTVKVGNEGLIFSNGNYFRYSETPRTNTSPTGVSDLSRPSGGITVDRTRPLTPNQVVDFVSSKTVEGQNDIVFNGVDVVPVTDIQRMAEGQLKSNMTGVIANTQTLNVSTENPNSMIMLSEALGIISAQGLASGNENDLWLYNSDMAALKKNALNPSATVDKPLLDKPVNLVFDQQNNRVIVSIGSGDDIEQVPIPASELSPAPTVLNQYQRLVNEFNTQGLLEAKKIKINTSINKSGGKVTEPIGNVFIPIGGYDIPTTVNIVGTFNKGTYSYSPLFTLQLEGQKVTISQEDLAPIFGQNMVFNNFDQAYMNITGISGEAIIAAYKLKNGIK